MEVKILNKSDYQNPFYQTAGSAGMDLYANIKNPVLLQSLDRKLIPTGIHIGLEEGYEAQIRPRSGLAAKHGITVLNTTGTIDSDYTGEICVILVNLSNEDYVVQPGERIAQMVISKYERVELKNVDSLEKTERGEGGFGHTGK